MIDITNLSITMNKNGKKLIDNLSFTLNEKDKLAIIGEEGNGKSTFIKALVDTNLVKYATINGKIDKHGYTIGYLSQFISDGWDNQTTTAFFLKDEPTAEEDFDKYANFDKLYQIASLLKFNIKSFENEVLIKNLSGGEKIKIQLIKILLKDPDILILDEPTNDLDIKSLQWLENFILTSEKPIIYISHDETLLENTANAILHIEQLKKKKECKCTFKRISYNNYVKERNMMLQKEERIALKERAEDFARMQRWQQIYNKVEHQLNSISRQDPSGGRLLKKKMKSVKSQEKRFEKQRENFKEIPSPEEAINVKIHGDSSFLTRTIFDFSLPKLSVENRILAQDLQLKMIGSKKYVIIGDNGVGKTTFLKKLYEKIKNDGSVKVEYMPQNYDDYLNQNETVIDFINSFCKNQDEITDARTYLGSMKFTIDEVENKIKELSGGQKAKLYILKIILSGAELLILDEPTRNLSPLSNPVIRKAFKDYGGAIVAVSHDRKFIKEVADEIYCLTPNGFIKTQD